MIPARLLARVRRVILFLVVGSALYGATRFDVVSLPEGALSPLYGIHAGDRMLVDRHAGEGALDQIWLYRGPAGQLLLGRVTEPPESLDEAGRAALRDGALWLGVERSLPGVPDSRELGPIPRAARVGRVVFVFPW